MNITRLHDTDPKECTEEEEQVILSEVEYAGITQNWINITIADRAIGSMLVREKKQKACILIQRTYREFKLRKQNALLLQSAIRIQRNWRRFLQLKRYNKMLKDMVMLHINVYYYRAARTIQAAFRGYYTRKNIHDQGKLKRLRLQSAQELLQCVAIRTRELVKNNQLPGVYSLRNSVCLSKIEKLLASLQTKTYNETVKETRAEYVVKMRKAFEKSMRSKDYTEVPFGTCKSKKIP